MQLPQLIDLLGLTDSHALVDLALRSTEQNYRTSLRKKLQSELIVLERSGRLAGSAAQSAVSALVELSGVADLTQPPTLNGLSISISHCTLAGGFVVCWTNGVQVGFDLEDVARVTPAIVSRVSTAEELSAAPTPAALWVAKEATFKALFKVAQPAVIGELSLLRWTPIKDKIWRFYACNRHHPTHEIEGVVDQTENLILGLAKLSSQLWSR